MFHKSNHFYEGKKEPKTINCLKFRALSIERTIYNEIYIFIQDLLFSLMSC